MIQFKRITLQNFLSFGKTPTTIELDTNLTALIIGHNKDIGQSGYSKNGVGKSTIFQAIVWCLFDEGISNIKKDAFVNLTNKKRLVVSLELTVKGIDLTITRGRKPARCEITKDGEPYTLHSSKNNDEAIKELLGMDLQVFLNTVILTNNINCFMNMKPSEQRDFMENILALHILSKRADFLKMENKTNAVNIQLEEQNLQNIVNNNTRIESNIVDLKKKENEWAYDFEAKTTELQTNLATYKAVDIAGQLESNVIREELEKKIDEVKHKQSLLEFQKKEKLQTLATEKAEMLTSLVNSYSLERDVILGEKHLQLKAIQADEMKRRSLIKEFTDELQKFQIGIQEGQRELDRLSDKLEKLEREKKQLEAGTCPYCLQPFHDAMKKQQILTEIKESVEEQNNISTLLVPIVQQEKSHREQIKREQDEFDEYKKEAEKVMTQSFDHLLERLEADQMKETQDVEDKHAEAVQNVEKEFIDKEAAIDLELFTLRKMWPDVTHTVAQCEAILSQIKMIEQNLKEHLANHKSNPYQEQILILQKDIQDVDKTKLDEMKKLESHYKILVKLLTDSKSFVRRNLIDQYVPYINLKINDYLLRLDSPHRVIINSDLSVDLEYMKQIVSYGNLSNGERLRVNLATSLAFRELLSLSGSKCNILCIDELLDAGGDSNFFYNVFSLLKKMPNESVFIISHRDELMSEVDKVITVEKYNGFSRLV